MTPTVMSWAREEMVQGKGGRLFVRSLRPVGKARGVVLLVHGFNSHSGYYAWVADRLVASGLAAYAVDLRGRGQSDGERFFVESMEDYVHDVETLAAIAREREPGLPVFVLGHSAGGVVACVYALEHQSELAGLVCESFAYQVPAPDLALAVLKGLSHIAPHAHVLKLENKDFSRDPGAVQAMNEDKLIANEVQPTQTVAAMVRADERLEKEIPLLKPARADPPWHARQGHEARRKPALLRPKRQQGQDAQALRGPFPRPAERRRSGGGHGGHHRLDRGENDTLKRHHGHDGFRTRSAAVSVGRPGALARR